VLQPIIVAYAIELKELIPLGLHYMAIQSNMEA